MYDDELAQSREGRADKLQADVAKSGVYTTTMMPKCVRNALHTIANAANKALSEVAPAAPPEV